MPTRKTSANKAPKTAQARATKTAKPQAKKPTAKNPTARKPTAKKAEAKKPAAEPAKNLSQFQAAIQVLAEASR